MKKVKNYLKLMRIKHYFKNLLIFLPLIFNGELFEVSKLITCIIGFVSFSLIASVVYIINDLKDVENDRKHPIKKNRPLASGVVKKKEAIILAIILIVMALLLNCVLKFTSLMKDNNFIVANILEIVYLGLNIAYSFGLKKKPIIDIAILVSGFLIRVLYGSAITAIEVSNWLYLTIMAGSFYMGLGKRRNEIKKQGDKSREVLKRYSKEFLDKNMYVCLTLSIAFYSLWCVTSSTIERLGNNYMVWTVPIIMIILMKYSLDVEGDSYGDPVDVLLQDKILLSMVLVFALIIFTIMYIL